MRAFLGHSDDVDEEDAIAEVIAQCKEALGGSTPVAGLLFASAEYEHQVMVDAIQRVWPGLPLIGSTSDGELSSRRGFEEDSVLLTLLVAEGVRAWVGVGRNLSQDIDAAVDGVLAGATLDDPPSLALTTFAPSTDASQVIRCFHERLPTTQCPLIGGLSGDHRDQARMREFAGSEVLSDSLPVLFLSGDVKVSVGIGSGWQAVGPASEITAADQHHLQEIDGRPALDFYRQYYGEVRDSHLGAFPVAISDNGQGGPWYLRAVLGTDLDSGAVRLAGGVRQGALLRVTEVVQAGVLSGTMASIEDALAGFDGQPDVALLFSCAARKWVLGSRAPQEIATVMSSLPANARDLAIAGLYVFGEIAPAQSGHRSTLHNDTCVTVLLGSAA